MPLSVFEEIEAFNLCKSINTGNQADYMTINSAIFRTIRVDQIIVSSTDVVDHDLTFYISPNDSDTASIGTVTIPALAGNDPAIPPIDLLPALSPLLDHIFIKIGEQPLVTVATAITATKEVTLALFGGYL